MLLCFNCRNICAKPHFHRTKVNIPGWGYWTCKKPGES